MTLSVGRRGQPLLSGLGGFVQEGHAVLGCKPDSPRSHPHCPMPSAPCPLFPRASAHGVLSAKETFSDPLVLWANSTFTKGPPQALVPGGGVPPASSCAVPSLDMSKPLSTTRLRHIHVCSSGTQWAWPSPGTRSFFLCHPTAWWNPSPGPLQALRICDQGWSLQEECSHG